MRIVDPNHVAFATTSYPTLGAPAAGPFVASLAERLAAAGWRVTVVAPAAPGDEAANDGPVRVRLVPTPLIESGPGRSGLGSRVAGSPRSALALPGLVAGLRRELLRSAPDAALVHAHWIPSATVARAARRPLAVTVHGSDLPLAERAAVATRALLGAAPVIVGTEHAAQRMRHLAPRADVRVIPPRGFASTPRPFADADPRRVACVTRLSPEKGIETLARAWRIVSAARPDAELRVIGAGPERPRLEGLPGVALVGRLAPEAVADELAAAAIAVQASPLEGYGIAALEALAVGRGVVASRTGAIAELDAPAPAVALVEPTDHAALAAAILTGLDEAPAMARAAAAAVLPSWDAIVAAVAEVYAETGRRR